MLRPDLDKNEGITILISIFLVGLFHRFVVQFLLTPLANTFVPLPKNSKLAITDRDKFNVAGWRCIVYMITVTFGCFVLLPQEWTFKPELYVHGWPLIPFTFMEKAYYYLAFGIYFYMLFDMFIQIRQKDFVAVLIHHIATLFLITFSFLTNCHRYGCVIMLIHDLADPFMEMAKCFFYAKYEKMANALFALFAATFIYTRNYLFPVHVIYSISLYAYHEDGLAIPNGNLWIRYCVIGALWILEILHIYWSYLIIKMLIRALTSNGVEGDIRDKDD